MAGEAVKIPFIEGSAPSTPAANRVSLYAKSDGLLYSKDDAGAETLVSGGSGGSPADILDIPTAETDDTLVLAPDGVGGVEFRAEAAGGGGWGTAVVTESGAAFTNWANDISTHWSSNATELISNPGTGNTGKARLTTRLFTMPCRIDWEVFFDSTGTSEAGGSTCVIGLGSSANPSKGPVGGLKMTSNNPAANGIGYCEEQAQTAYPLGASTFALDTWLSIQTFIASGNTVSVIKGGTVIGGTAWNFNSNGFLYESLILCNFQSKVKVRNINVYQLG